MRRVFLLFLCGNLGDMVLAVLVIRALRARYPNVRLVGRTAPTVFQGERVAS